MQAVPWRPTPRDVALALGLAALTQVELHLSYALATPPTPAHALIGLLLTLPLAWRRRAPLVVCVGVITLFAVQPVLVTPPNTFGEALAMIVATFSLAVHPHTWKAAVVGGGLAVSLSVLWAYLRDDPDTEPIPNAVFAVLVWLCGAIVRRQLEHARASQVAVVREREASAARAAELLAAERARIARELHDVVAHGIGVVVLQARGGRRMLTARPDDAREAFDQIERVSTQCLQEMRRLLGILRVTAHDAVEPTGTSPQPGLGQLDILVDQLRTAGLTVDVTVDGERRELPPGLDLSAYRIVQEALTNALRHAPGSTVKLQLRYEPDAIAVEVVDDGPGTTDGVPGHGLLGMRERAELYGGSLRSGPEPNGGYAVRARLPAPVVSP